MTAPLPGIRRRLASLAYESLLLLGVLAFAFLVPQLAITALSGKALPGWILLAHVFVVLGGYFLWSWRQGGQTLAMQTWKLQLRAQDGSTPTWRQLGLRYLLAWPSLLFYGAGLFWALFDRDRQFLHDRLAGTRIVFKQ
ncbi:hypothetical protein B9N43_01765 [Denitratisoma sp. DHT3]|uniref:RDD family protein n=1 Tax=Denitratisoma sp. DHT3 TaxID=1981880 RepID=UPI001198BAE2|nr:RDD family protein [Denitratisoma sp. DHT3]QDX80091.1 hypothetical protein B9N43_01765 [Denitratisoma sp. DHT3]